MTSEARGWLLSMAAVACLCGCATPKSTIPRQYQDPRTAATITVGEEVLTFARERPEFAVHARDYLTLLPFDVNHAGKHGLYFLVYDWSTREQPAGEDDGAPVTYFIVADGREIKLTPVPGESAGLGLSAPPAPAPSRHASARYALTTREILDFVRTSTQLHAARSSGDRRERYALWEDRRQAIDLLLAEVPVASP